MTLTPWVLVTGLALGAVLLVGSGPTGPRSGAGRRAGRPPDRATGPRWSSPTWRSAAGALVCGVVALLATGAVTGPVAGHLVLASLVVVGAWHLVRGSRARSAHQHATDAAGRACELLVGELGAGVPTGVALARVAEHHGALTPVVAAAGVGSDVPVALRQLARSSRVRVWSRVADAWAVSERSGAALAPVLARVAQAERDEAARRRLVATELADAVATARLMATLPLLLVGAASLGGGTAATFLLTTWAGVVCAALGAGLIAAGLVWIERISAGGRA